MGAERLLERAGWGLERRHMSCWLGRPARQTESGRRAESELLALAGRPGAGALAAASWCVRAERALAEGRARAALGDLRRAREADAKSPWPRLYLAAARFQLGEPAAARREADALCRRHDGLSCGFAVRAILAANEGRRAEAEGLLERALERSREDWLLGLRGTLRARWGDLEPALADLSQALASDPTPSVLAQRADVHNRLGRFWLALRDLRRLKRRLPADPEPERRAAAVHLDQAQFADAAGCLERAIALAPGDVSLRLERARVFFIQGDVERARAELLRAQRGCGRDARLQEERARLEILSGRGRAAERLLGGLSAARRAYWLGYLRCRQGRYAESEALFSQAASLDPGNPRAPFYRLVARVLGEAPAAAPRQPGQRLWIMGLGYRQPFQVSREVLHTLKRCEAFYSNLSDSAVTDFLGLFPAPMRAIVFRRSDRQSTRCARDVMPGFALYSRVAVVTRGHPLFYGRLAWRLVRDCARRGIGVSVPGSVSVADTILGLSDHARGTDLGVQVRNSSDLEGLDLRLPLVLYNFSSMGQWRTHLSRTLAKLYPAGHPCYLLPGSGAREFDLMQVSVDALQPVLDRADEAVTLLVPACQ